MKLKNLFRSREIKTYQESETQLLKQNKDNVYIMQWMWVIFLIALSQAIFNKVIQIQTFWMVISSFIFMFIHSLKVSVKQNRIIILQLKGGK